MRDTLLRPVNQLQSLARALFETLSSSQTPPDPPVAALAACDEQLAEALRKSRTHLLKQRRIEALLAEVHELDVQLLEIIETLGHGQKELAAVIEEGEERVRAADAATKCSCSSITTSVESLTGSTAAISYSSLISYATKVADYTSAPPAAAIDPKAPHQPQPYAFRPPFPQEAVLSRSRLMGGGPIGPIGEFQPIGEGAFIRLNSQ